MTVKPDPASDGRPRDVAGKVLSISIPECETRDDHSLLALILGRSQGDPDQLAGDLLARFGSLAAVAAADPSELMRRFLMGPAALSDLKVLRELAVRLVRVEACRRPVITSWSALQAYVRAAMAHLPREQFRVLYLDRRNILLRDEWIAEGTVDHAPVYNAGPARVARVGRIPDIAETRHYVANVLDCYLALAAGRKVFTVRQCRPQGGAR